MKQFDRILRNSCVPPREEETKKRNKWWRLSVDNKFLWKPKLCSQYWPVHILIHNKLDVWRLTVNCVKCIKLKVKSFLKWRHKLNKESFQTKYQLVKCQLSGKMKGHVRVKLCFTSLRAWCLFHCVRSHPPTCSHCHRRLTGSHCPWRRQWWSARGLWVAVLVEAGKSWTHSAGGPSRSAIIACTH